MYLDLASQTRLRMTMRQGSSFALFHKVKA
jgi:hypothetical protein